MPRYFIPETDFGKMDFSKKTARKFNPETVSVCGFSQSGYKIKLNVKKAKEIFSPYYVAANWEASDLDGEKLHVVVVEEKIPDVAYSMQGETADNIQKEADIFSHVRGHLELLSCISNMSVRLHVTKHFVLIPYSDDTLHIAINTSPPGDNGLYRHRDVCGIVFRPDCSEVKYPSYAAGYGTMVIDDKERDIAQIVGSTIYLFLPCMKDDVHLLGGRGIDLFGEILKRAWHDYSADSAEESKNQTIRSAKAYKSLSDNLNFLQPGFVEEKSANIDREVAALQRKICELVTKKRTLIAVLKGYKPPTKRTSDDEWRSIRKNPLIDFMEKANDNAPQIHTKPILMESDDGNSIHDLGRFVVRISNAGVSIWSKDHKHPEEVQHPHIGRLGSVCFGNISTEISTALAEFRLGDVVDMAINWLKNGYDSSLTETKVEEWPEANISEDVK